MNFSLIALGLCCTNTILVAIGLYILCKSRPAKQSIITPPPKRKYKPRRTLTLQTQNKIRELYKKGKGPTEIAKIVKEPTQKVQYFISSKITKKQNNE